MALALFIQPRALVHSSFRKTPLSPSLVILLFPGRSWSASLTSISSNGPLLSLPAASSVGSVRPRMQMAVRQSEGAGQPRLIWSHQNASCRQRDQRGICGPHSPPTYLTPPSRPSVGLHAAAAAKERMEFFCSVRPSAGRQASLTPAHNHMSSTPHGVRARYPMDGRTDVVVRLPTGADRRTERGILLLLLLLLGRHMHIKNMTGFVAGAKEEVKLRFFSDMY